MFRFSFMAVICAALFITTPSFAQNAYTATDAFVRAAPATTTAAYLTVSNPSDKDDALIGAQADWAQRIELHNVSQDDQGVMKMFQVESIALPAKGEMILQPGGYHLMIFGVKDTLAENDYKTITLKFGNGQTITQEFIVKPMTFQGDHHDHGHHHDHTH